MKPIIPVYLNQNYVFDLLAMLKGGLATVTSVSQSENEGVVKHASVSGGFGLGSAFSALLKVDMSAHQKKETEGNTGTTTAEERVHTPASLLFQLINELREGGHIIDILSDKYVSGQIVEFETSMTKNPIIETLDGVLQVLDVAEVFQDPPQKTKGQRNRPSGDALLKKQLATVTEALKAGNTIDLIGSIENPTMSVMVTIDMTYLSDPLMSNLVEGKFKVLGKIIRKVDEDDTPLNLLRKSALSKTPFILKELVSAINAMSQDGQFNFPDASAEIKGPAIHVLPIAIYV